MAHGHFGEDSRPAPPGREILHLGQSSDFDGSALFGFFQRVGKSFGRIDDEQFGVGGFGWRIHIILQKEALVGVSRRYKVGKKAEHITGSGSRHYGKFRETAPIPARRVGRKMLGRKMTRNRCTIFLPVIFFATTVLFQFSFSAQILAHGVGQRPSNPKNS